MMRKIVLIVLFGGFIGHHLAAQSVIDSLKTHFNNQLLVYPQEKLYLHTDKPYYISGEKIWFRAYLVDACTHQPAAFSRYIYVELIDPLDSVVTRIKIRPEKDIYQGYVPVPDDVPGGDYMIRAYTSFMRSQDEHYFFTKNVHIGDPNERIINTEADYEFLSDKKVAVRFRFSHAQLGNPIIPERVSARVNNGRLSGIRNDKGTFTYTFQLAPGARYRSVFLEIVNDKRIYRQFLPVPSPEDVFDVSFFPEGGAILPDVLSRVGFKALRSNGLYEDITGIIYDGEGNQVVEIKSEHMGMGSISFTVDKGKSYYAECRNRKGVTKRFDLPAVQDNGHALVAKWSRNQLFVGVNSTSPHNEGLYLVIHSRGTIQYAEKWNKDKEFIHFQKHQFPSGILNLVLFDSSMRPLSERLVFVLNDDQAQMTCLADKENYEARSLVRGSVKLTDNDGNPLPGSFSVSVTDDKEVHTDTTSGILTNLLLTSDIRGHIENPAVYFNGDAASSWALDNLLLTQGWRRYDTGRLAKGDYMHPSFYLEVGPEISGTVKSVLFGKPVEGIDVVMVSTNKSYFEAVQTDQSGRFLFQNCELPDSSKFMAYVEPRSGMKRMDLIIDRDTFPVIRNHPLVSQPLKADKNTFIQYVDKAEQQYTSENGIRIVHLSEVEITADRKPMKRSGFYSQPDNYLTEDVIEKSGAVDIKQLLMRFPGVIVSGNDISIRGMGPPLLVIDGIPTDISDLNIINVFDVAQIDLLKNPSNMALYGSRGANGIIVIYTKEGKVNYQPKPFHIKAFMPLGYQTLAEFYAPRYDTPQARNNNKADFRTTIHWQPEVRTDSLGQASFEFYAADSPTTYTVLMEGVTDNGKIIRQKETIIRNKE